MKIAIRDDDLCYWTKYEDFRKVYDFLDVPVSISVVPFATNRHNNSYPYGHIEDKRNMPIHLNSELVDSLKKDIQNKKCEILLHGITHEYKSINGKQKPEMLWRTNKQINTLLPKAKKYLEDVFGQKISIFIAPSDKMKRSNYKILSKLQMNTCGLIKGIFSRPISFKTIKNYIIRWTKRFTYKFPYCGILEYNGWNEVQTYQDKNYDELIKIFDILNKNDYPMVLELHYWQLLKNENLLNEIKKFILFATDKKCEFILLSNVLRSKI